MPSYGFSKANQTIEVSTTIPLTDEETELFGRLVEAYAAKAANDGEVNDVEEGPKEDISDKFIDPLHPPSAFSLMAIEKACGHLSNKNLLALLADAYNHISNDFS